MRKLDPLARAFFAEWGRKGAKVKMQTTTPKQRQAQAKKAAAARWSKTKGGAQ